MAITKDFSFCWKKASFLLAMPLELATLFLKKLMPDLVPGYMPGPDI
jgi:hypothetical protein